MTTVVGYFYSLTASVFIVVFLFRSLIAISECSECIQGCSLQLAHRTANHATSRVRTNAIHTSARLATSTTSELKFATVSLTIPNCVVCCEITVDNGKYYLLTVYSVHCYCFCNSRIAHAIMTTVIKVRANTVIL